MDALFFGVKRAYYATLRYARKQLARFGMTPARFDLLRFMYDRGGDVYQDYARGVFHVARSTMSRMMLALVRLGWVRRERDARDGRTYWCQLTSEGEMLVSDVMQAIVNSRVVGDAIDAALGTPKYGRERDAKLERIVARSLFQRLALAFASTFGMPSAFWETDVNWNF